MPTADAVLEFFRRNDGLGEEPAGSNSNWITKWYNMDRQPWCAMTVSRAMAEAGFGNVDAVHVNGVSTTTRKGWAYCPYVKRDFVNAGRWVDDPNLGQPGDLVIFDWDKDGKGDHIGVVESRLADGTYLCREGNNSWNNIALRRRPPSIIAGFCRPPYDGQGGPDIPPPTPDGTPAYPGRLLRYPPITVGEDVRTWQAQMAARGWRRMKADSAYGPTSRELCVAFQKEKGLKPDGKVGPQTWARTWVPG